MANVFNGITGKRRRAFSQSPPSVALQQKGLSRVSFGDSNKSNIHTHMGKFTFNGDGHLFLSSIPSKQSSLRDDVNAPVWKWGARAGDFREDLRFAPWTQPVLLGTYVLGYFHA